MIEFITWSSDRAVSTVETRLAAVSFAHRLAGLPDPTDNDEVRLVLKGLRRKKGKPPVRKEPLAGDDLEKVITALPCNTMSSLRDRAIILVGFAGAFRRSELAELCLGDVQFKSSGMLRAPMGESSRNQPTMFASRRVAMLSRRRTVTLILHLTIVVSLLLSTAPFSASAQVAPAALSRSRSSVEAPAASSAPDTPTDTTFASPLPTPTPEPQDNVTINHRAKGATKADSSRPSDDQHLVRFDLEAKGVTRFNKPVTLTVNLQGLVDLSSLPEDVRPYLAYRSPDNPDEWISVPIHVNWDENTISAQVEHFSDWQAGEMQMWTFVYNPPTNNLFSGAATYATSLQVPPGRNGLQPEATITHGLYYAKDAPGLYIERRNNGGQNGSPQNTTGEYWIIRQADGTEARLGYNADSEQTTARLFQRCTCTAPTAR